MSVVWGGYLETGFEKIDKDHRALVERVNAILRLVKNNADMTEIKYETARLLNDFVHHACVEEFIMMTTGYDEYVKHKAEHDRLLNQLSAYEKLDIQKHDAYNELCLFVTSFFYKHVDEFDSPLALFLHGHDCFNFDGADHDIESAVKIAWSSLKVE